MIASNLAVVRHRTRNFRSYPFRIFGYACVEWRPSLRLGLESSAVPGQRCTPLKQHRTGRGRQRLATISILQTTLAELELGYGELSNDPSQVEPDQGELRREI